MPKRNIKPTYNKDNKFAIIPAEELPPLIGATEALLTEIMMVNDKTILALTDDATLKNLIDKLSILNTELSNPVLDQLAGSLLDHNLKNRVDREEIKSYLNGKFEIFINILKIIIQRLNMAAIKEIEQPIYKIKNMDTGMYSTGGMKKTNVTRIGKVWNSASEVRKHLAMFDADGGRYSEGNWVVVAIDGIESPSFLVKKFYEDRSKK